MVKRCNKYFYTLNFSIAWASWSNTRQDDLLRLQSTAAGDAIVGLSWVNDSFIVGRPNHHSRWKRNAMPMLSNRGKWRDCCWRLREGRGWRTDPVAAWHHGWRLREGWGPDVDGWYHGWRLREGWGPDVDAWHHNWRLWSDGGWQSHLGAALHFIIRSIQRGCS